MRFFEFEAREIVKRAGIPVTDYGFCTTADGTRIAVATIGSGPPLVRASHWLSHVEHDLESPVWRPWLRELSRDRTYIRYDQRGSGLSDRSFDSLSLDVWVRDLETNELRTGSPALTDPNYCRDRFAASETRGGRIFG